MRVPLANLCQMVEMGCANVFCAVDPKVSFHVFADQPQDVGTFGIGVVSKGGIEPWNALG